MNHFHVFSRIAFQSPRAALALALVAVGCAGENSMEIAAEQLGQAEGALLLPPATCQDIRNANPGAVDSTYVLHIDNDHAKPWRAYCHNMASAPAEYVTLQNVGPSANVSQYNANGMPGSTVTTQYARVRIDPATLLVDISDQTFATSSGQLTHGSETVTSMPFGVAMSCDASPSGAANIDLTGTPFAVAAGEFLQGGTGSSGGSATYSSDDQIVDITGGGYCGWTCASPATFNPFNDTGTFQLDLVYRAPASCADIKAILPNAGNGTYTLFVDHDEAKPWKAHCHNMATAPAEYLSLPNVGPGANFSQYTASGNGTNVRTRYSKVRIDPATLLVDISDQTFTTSSGQLTHGSETVTSMPFGVAMSCNNAPSGVGNIDLTGTPFAVATGEFLQGGTNGAGSAVYSSNDRVVALTGGGFCGWTCASPATFNPFNDAGDFQLDLVYAP